MDKSKKPRVLLIVRYFKKEHDKENISSSIVFQLFCTESRNLKPLRGYSYFHAKIVYYWSEQIKQTNLANSIQMIYANLALSLFLC